MKPLTTQQQSVVERNHNLIYGFAHLYDLPIETFYDILSLSLCKAVQYYDESKGKLSTYAYAIMYSDMCEYYRQQKKYHKIQQNVKKDLTNDETYGIIFTHDLTHAIQQRLTNTQKNVLHYFTQGYKQAEIARMLNQSESNIHQILKRCKKVVKEVLDEYETGD